MGPRLFSIYVNGFSESVSQGELHIHANDTTAFITGDSTDDVVRKLNFMFAEICRWCNSNKLTLHTGKSEVMILQRNIFVGPLLPVQCGNTVLKYTYSTKSLGVERDQVHEMCNSYFNRINTLKGMRHLPSKLLEDIFICIC